MLEKHEITNVLRALHTQGITKVEIESSGGGDEGTFENSKFYDQDNKEVSVDWNKTLNLSEDETFDIDDFEGLIYGDQGRLNQWYSFAGDYSCNGTVTINTETGDYTDSADYTVQEYTDESRSGNVYKDKNKSIYDL